MFIRTHVVKINGAPENVPELISALPQSAILLFALRKEVSPKIKQMLIPMCVHIVLRHMEIVELLFIIDSTAEIVYRCLEDTGDTCDLPEEEMDDICSEDKDTIIAYAEALSCYINTQNFA